MRGPGFRQPWASSRALVVAGSGGSGGTTMCSHGGNGGEVGADAACFTTESVGRGGSAKAGGKGGGVAVKVGGAKGTPGSALMGGCERACMGRRAARVGSAAVAAATTRLLAAEVLKKSGNIFRAGIFLDVVGPATRAEGPHGGTRAGSQTKSD